MSTPDPSRWSLPNLRIDRDGNWLSDGIEITHAGILVNLWQNLGRDSQGYYVQAGPVRIPVEVEDTPLVVVRVEAAAAGLRLILNDGGEEPLDPATLRLASGEVPYCRVRGGQFDARLSRAAAWQLAQFIHYDETSNSATLVLAGARYPLTVGFRRT